MLSQKPTVCDTFFRYGAHDCGAAVLERNREYDEVMEVVAQADLEHQIKAEEAIMAHNCIRTSKGTEADTCTGCRRSVAEGEQYVIDGDARRCAVCERRHNFEGTNNDPIYYEPQEMF